MTRSELWFVLKWWLYTIAVVVVVVTIAILVS